MLLPCCGAVGVMSRYLALVWKDWALGHLRHCVRVGAGGGREVGALGASARTLLTN